MRNPTLTVEMVSLKDIKPFVGNAKEHPASQIKQIVASIQEFGFNDPVAIDETNTLIEGHGRYLAAKKMKLDKIPAIKLSHLDEAQRKAYIIAHNKLTLNSGFDYEKLQEALLELKELNFDLSLTGFDLTEVEGYLRGLPGETDANAEWVGMPDFSNEDKGPKRQLIVSFKDDVDVKAFGELIGQKITDKTRSIWFPYQEPMDSKSKSYVPES